MKLVFRTFGDDIVEVARELDLFVDGRHPIGLPALPNRFRLKLQPSAHCIATVNRDGFEADGTALVWARSPRYRSLPSSRRKGPTRQTTFTLRQTRT